jgi:hypothetical protein
MEAPVKRSWINYTPSNDIHNQLFPDVGRVN